MATTNFGFTLLTGTENAGWQSINTLITNIDTQLQANTTRLLPTTSTSGYTLTWNGTAWTSSQINTSGIADNAVTLGTKTTGDYVGTLAGTANQIASTGATSGEGTTHTLSLVSSAILPGAPTVGTAVGSYPQTSSTSRVSTVQYVNDAVANVNSSGAVALSGDVTGTSGATVIGSGVVTSDKIADSTIVLGDLATTLQNLLVPTGTVSSYAGSTAPAGWVLCDGTTYNGNTGTAYNALYTVIGTTYGGTQSAFAVPDLRGRAVAGKDDMGGTAASRLTTTGGLSANNTLGATGGAQTVTLTSAQSGLPSHTHGDTFSATASSHTHTYSGWDYNGTVGSGTAKAAYLPISATTGSTAPTVTISGSVSSVTAANASSAHTNVQPTIVLNYIIKL